MSAGSERIWIFLAAALVIVAVVFLWRNNFSAAFVSAALGACAWFLSYRAKLGATHNVRDDNPVDGDNEN